MVLSFYRYIYVYWSLLITAQSERFYISYIPYVLDLKVLFSERLNYLSIYVIFIICPLHSFFFMNFSLYSYLHTFFDLKLSDLFFLINPLIRGFWFLMISLFFIKTVSIHTIYFLSPIWSFHSCLVCFSIVKFLGKVFLFSFTN